VLSALLISVYRTVAVWSPLERRYATTYLWTGLPFLTEGSYTLLYVRTPAGPRLALDEDLVTLIAPDRERSFDLSDEARAAGATALAWESRQHVNGALHAFLYRWIYGRHSLLDLVAPSLWGAVAVLLGGLLGAGWRELTDARWSRGRFPGADPWVAPAFDVPFAHLSSPSTHPPSIPPGALVPASAVSNPPNPVAGGALRKTSDAPEWWVAPVVK
jgi:hypothetical protein